MLTKEQQEIAFQTARAVAAGHVSKKDGAHRLEQELRLKNSSARYMIYVYLHMVKGLQFTRALNSSDTEYFLERIEAVEGLEKLKLAIQALLLHIRYRESTGVTQHANRKILQRYEHILQQSHSVERVEPVDINELNQLFLRQVQSALLDSAEKRRQRLAHAPKKPQKVAQIIYVFQRNPDVVAEVLLRANGVCERCDSKAPFFRRSNGTPYLEVHHRTPLADEGNDTVENAIALCPNCHRNEHFGAPHG